MTRCKSPEHTLLLLLCIDYVYSAEEERDLLQMTLKPTSWFW